MKVASIDSVVQFAIDHGWTVVKTKPRRLRFDRPGSTPVFVAIKPGDRCAWHNSLRYLKAPISKEHIT